MKVRCILLAVILLTAGGGRAAAERQLDSAEVVQILQQLTSQPKESWIPAGVIEARHQEYRAPKTTDPNEIRSKIKQKITAYMGKPDKVERIEHLQKARLDAIPFNARYELANEYTMNSNVIVRFDGEKYYWEINVDSRSDSVEPGKELAGNFMTNRFNLAWNAKRVFAWDGEKYTTYCSPVNHAMVDSTGYLPLEAGGPLTAGLIPWGHEYYSYDSLTAAETEAVETDVDGQTVINLTVNYSEGKQMSFVLDPAKSYAVISRSITGFGNLVFSNQYSDYQLVSGNWVPETILLERFEAGSNRLLSRDLWEIIAIDGSIPGGADSFEVQYEHDALIEYVSSVTDRPAMYRYSEMIDTEQLLSERLAFAANEGVQPQNCATAALKYAAGQLGKNVTDSQLASLVAEPDNETSLYAVKQFAEGMGLYCRAVTMDISTLKDLENCRAILHVPGKKHFVVLESIDNSHVRIVDLSNNKFYYRTDINFFSMDWSAGTALLLSNDSIEGDFTDIPDSELGGIVGASGYSCTELLQDDDFITCDYFGELCWGLHIDYFERHGCEGAESGSCEMIWMPRCQTCQCVESPEPGRCTGSWPWTYYYMWACS
ncbi:MAG: cysteine peptidase family C39 domain-containing protein [Planctomycetota bacterium]|jgi:hypothetical protein